jgi:hypothetical protein
MSKRLIVSAVCVAAALAASTVVGNARDNKQRFKIDLVGFEENPTLSTTGRGRLDVKLDDANERIEYVLRYSDLEGAVGGTVLFAHIHLGQRATNGGVVAFLCGGGGKPACPSPEGEISGVIEPADIVGPTAQGIIAGESTAFAEFSRAIRAGYTYGNVHTTARPSGEIRGQIDEHHHDQ